MSTTRIIVVAPEANTRNALAELLQDEGFVVETAVNGVDASRKVTAFKPCVAIVDLQMPRADGVGVVSQLRARPDAPAVIALAAFSAPAQADAALRAGASACVVEPVRFEELLAVLGTILRHREVDNGLVVGARRLDRHGSARG